MLIFSLILLGMFVLAYLGAVLQTMYLWPLETRTLGESIIFCWLWPIPLFSGVCRDFLKWTKPEQITLALVNLIDSRTNQKTGKNDDGKDND